MGLIPETVIEEVLARTDILETVQQYVTLKKAGANFKGLCPFHDENTPSFNVHPGMGIYKCFGCGEGGHSIQFLMKIEGWNFPETVRHLAEKAGIEIPEEDEEEAEARQKKRRGRKIYLEIMAAARAFFEERLWNQEGKVAQLYLQERGISEPTARAFGLGYAPDSWDQLLNHLQRKGFNGQWLQRAGLVNERDSGGYYDRFRHRVIFPIIDVWGNTLAFGGRTLAEDLKGAKYINSPETSFYTKGNELYGLDVAKREIQKEEFVLVVEGNFDVIALHDQGLSMTVAPMGTALTERQARLMGRYARRVVIAFDGDSAGEEATLRCMSSLDKAGLEALVIRFTEGDDPDTFVRREGVAALRAKINAAEPLMAWALNRVLRPVEGAPIESRVQALKEVADLLEVINDQATWEFYAQEVARRLEIDPGQIKNYLRRPENARQALIQEVKAVHMAPEIDRGEYGVLVVLLDHPEWLSDFFREELDKLLASQELAQLLRLAHSHFETRRELNPALLVESLERPAMRELVSRALAEPSRGELYPPEQGLRHYRDCVRTLKRRWALELADFLELELQSIDIMTQREEYKAKYRQLEQARRFLHALDQAERHGGTIESRPG